MTSDRISGEVDQLDSAAFRKHIKDSECRWWSFQSKNHENFQLITTPYYSFPQSALKSLINSEYAKRITLLPKPSNSCIMLRVSEARGTTAVLQKLVQRSSQIDSADSQVQAFLKASLTEGCTVISAMKPENRFIFLSWQSTLPVEMRWIAPFLCSQQWNLLWLWD